MRLGLQAIPIVGVDVTTLSSTASLTQLEPDTPYRCWVTFHDPIGDPTQLVLAIGSSSPADTVFETSWHVVGTNQIYVGVTIIGTPPTGSLAFTATSENSMSRACVVGAQLRVAVDGHGPRPGGTHGGRHK